MHVRQSIMKISLGALVLGSAVSVAIIPGLGSPSALAQQDRPGVRPAGAPLTTEKSLFDRLGGTYPIAAVVDDYINNLVKDAVVMANPAVKASVEKAAASNGVPGLKYQITAFVIQATGGPYQYQGRDMKLTHKTLNITQSEWDASAAVLKATLNRLNVPAREQQELFALVETTHDDIVVGSSPPPGRGAPPVQH